MIHLLQPYETLCVQLPSLHLLYWGSLFNYCWTDGYVHPSALFLCSPDLSITSLFLLGHSYYSWFRLREGCTGSVWFHSLKLTAWQVCVAYWPSISLVSKSKLRTWKPHVARTRLGTKFLETISVLMKALFHKRVLSISNVSIVS